MKKAIVWVLGTLLFFGMSVNVSAAEGKSELAKAKKATAKYHQVERAIDDGYTPTDEFVAVPGLGVMGYHYVNQELVDEHVEASSPEVLLYVPKKNGDLKLVGVEYLSITENELFGHEFDPPHGDIPHSLHAWVWKNNPNGMFAPFNPSLE